jgi:hypothetical protein
VVAGDALAGTRLAGKEHCREEQHGAKNQRIDSHHSHDEIVGGVREQEDEGREE